MNQSVRNSVTPSFSYGLARPSAFGLAHNKVCAPASPNGHRFSTRAAVVIRSGEWAKLIYSTGARPGLVVRVGPPGARGTWARGIEVG